MTYEYPENVTGMLSAFEYVNSITDGWFATGTILIVFAVAFLAIKFGGFKAQQAFVSAAFIGTLMALVYLVLGLVQPMILVVMVIILIAGIVWLWFGDKVEY